MRPAPFRLLLAAAIALLAVPRSSGFPVTFGGMACDLPEGWKVVSSTEGSFAAASDGLVAGTGVFQVSWFPAPTFVAARDMLENITKRLHADGDVSEFVFDGREVALAEVAFLAGPSSVRGYLLCVDGEQADVAVLAYADDASYDAQVDFLLSSMDSFRVSAGLLNVPGPISQFLFPYPGPAATERVPFAGGSVPVRADPEELDAMQALIEREARILVAYTRDPARDEAWKRSYRMIYRDSYPRLADTARDIGRLAGGERSSPAERATAVLSWLQGFSYARTGSLSDLLSPLATVASRSGDCDARALALVIILSHLGTGGVILVSSTYAHAVAAVAVEAPGVGFTLDGRRYLTAETTKKAPLGWIAEEQRDLAKWVVVRFDE